jgi:hypothetical protein
MNLEKLKDVNNKLKIKKGKTCFKIKKSEMDVKEYHERNEKERENEEDMVIFST